MYRLQTLCLVACSALIALGACGDDETSGQGGNAGQGGSAGDGGTGNIGGTAGEGGTTSQGGMGGMPPMPECGDGMLNGTDECDDGNTAPGDGCSDSCVVEAGWTCDNADPSVCTAICGDFMVLGAEQCDDGNIATGDGCSDLCAYEATCQNTIVEPGETCDDGNNTAGDGCDDMCQLEAGNVCSMAVDLNDINVAPLTGNTIVYSGTTVGSSIVNHSDPSCSTGTPGSETVIHKFTATQPTVLIIETVAVGGISDTVLWGHYDCLGTTDEAFCDDDDGPGNLSLSGTLVPAGATLYILVANYGAGAGTYELHVTPTPAHVVPGGSDCAAPAALSNGTFYGEVESGDPSNFEPSCLFGSTGAPEAVFEMTFANPTSLVIDAGGVPLTAYDIALHLQDGVCDPANAMELACEDAVGSSRPEQLVQNNVPAGTYYVVVDGSDTPEAGPYLLNVQTSECGDGAVLRPAEQCDDANTANGDGCSDTCTCEPFTESEVNDDYTMANPIGAGICMLQGAVSVPMDMDWFAITLAANETLSVETVDGLTNTCAPGGDIDSEIEIYDTDGTTSLAFNDDKGPDTSSARYCSAASFTATVAGTYYVRVSSSVQYAPTDTFDYGVQIGIE